MTWTTFFEAWPDWQDAEKRVEIELEDGTMIAGRLAYDDWYCDDDGEEYPIWLVVSDDGVKHSFAENERWRFVLPEEKE